MSPDWIAQLESQGFAVIPGALARSEVERLRQEIGVASQDGHALRGLLELDWVRELARSETVRSLMEAALGKECFAVRGLFFNKIPGANWLVPPHQDLSIAVEEKLEAAGFGPWSRKEGIVHVQPPREILENMATIRLHLDDCDETNGALRVVVGSHRNGKLKSDAISRAPKQGEIGVPVPESGAMIFRPLLIHASSPALVPSHRRVVHLEFAASELTDGLKWRWRI